MNPKNELCLTHIIVKSPWNHIDLVVTLLLILGLALNAWGIVLNATVTIVNNDTMPVITETYIVLLENRGTPRLILSEGNLLLLADRIRIDFPDIQKSIPGEPLSSVVHWWSKWLCYPLEGGLYMVSIGDCMRWSGTIIFLLMIPLILVAIIRRLSSGDLPRISL